jgi:hypothetical protein
LQRFKNFSDQTFSHRWETFNGNSSVGVAAEPNVRDAAARGVVTKRVKESGKAVHALEIYDGRIA